MKKTLLSLAALTVISAPALAADMSMKRHGLMMPPSFTWSGFYAGANAGYAFGERTATTTGTAAFNTLVAPGFVPGALKVKPEGFIGGVQAGYNAQFGAVVAGVETDIQFGNLKGTSSFTGGTILGTQLTTSARSDLSYLGTVRARLGVAAAERLLIYATAGLAYGEVKTGARVVGVQAPGLVWDGASKSMRTGFAVGAGAEYAFTNNLTLKAEYLYYDLGKSSALALGNAAVRGVGALNGIDYANEVSNSGSILRAGANVKF